MILGHIDAVECGACNLEQIQKAIAYCRNTDTSLMKDGRYPLESKDFMVSINERRTGKKEERMPEVHKECAELHYMVSGREYIGYYPDFGDNQVRMDCLREKDALFYEENPGSVEVMLPMMPGSYAIFFPNDVHRPFCQMDEPEDVKMIVIKIQMNTL
ncbi:DUF386 domain-containing protein [Clostridiales bacterium TF09-2AC]|nr:DUF386 domain-containing protein [Clostridiales bacterium TF09-2AC]